MRNAGLEETQAGIKIAGRNINNLGYTDDSTLMAETEEELKSLLMDVKEESEKVSLKLNIQRTKIMASSPITSWKIDGETMTDFIFLGSKITADGDCSHEIKRHLLFGRKVMTNLNSILKSRDITLSTKVRLVSSVQFSHSVVLLIFLPSILIAACASSSPAFLMMYSAYKLNKQGDNIPPWCTPFSIWNHSVVPYPALTFAPWPRYRGPVKLVKVAGMKVRKMCVLFLVLPLTTMYFRSKPIFN